MIPFAATAVAAPATVGALQAFAQIFDRLKDVDSARKDFNQRFAPGSLTQVAQAMRVEPYCLVDSDLLNSEYLSDILHCLHSLFTGMWLQAVESMGSITGVDVVGKLAPLNPNRSLARENFGAYAAEDFRFALPAPHKTHLKPTPALVNRTMALEAAPSELAKSLAMEADDRGKDINAVLREQASLSIGKFVDVTVAGEGTRSAKARVAIRLMVNEIPTSALVQQFTYANVFDTSFKHRVIGARSGRIGWMDLVLGRDLIKAHRNAQIKDKTGVLSKINNRAVGNMLAGVKTGNPSLATASNLVAMSKDTLNQMELKLGGPFTNFKIRQELFERTQLMVIAVFDKEWDRVTFYHYGIQDTTTMSVRELKQASKDNGSVAVMDIMKAYMAGGAAHL